MEGKKNANTNVFELRAIKIILPLHHHLTTSAIITPNLGGQKGVKMCNLIEKCTKKLMNCK